MSYPKVLGIGTIPGFHGPKQGEALGQIRDLALGIFWHWCLDVLEAALEFGKPSVPILGMLALKRDSYKDPGACVASLEKGFCLFV